MKATLCDMCGMVIDSTDDIRIISCVGVGVHVPEPIWNREICKKCAMTVENMKNTCIKYKHNSTL